MFIRHAILIVLVSTLSFGAHAETRLDMATIVKEVEILKNVDGGMTLVMWMPEEYWRAAVQATGRLSDKGADEFLTVMRPYTMVAVLAAETGIAGSFTYAPSEVLRRSTRLEDSAGTFYEPLDPQSVNPGMKNLLQLLKPVLTNAMGPMGANLDIMLFPATNKAGARIADATQEGSFTVHINDLSFRYHLPLGSLLPPAVDPRSGDTFPGNYHFNPFTGEKLAPAPAAAAPAKP